ncbi:dephospho-CoA kinase [Alkaliphilus serpentinus]|uniref:Dephospho-CoA kinase n=1 Tax=Alkaliphilus serpentinus TaxID=1482731 RepID=A0A833HM87_9FIRM|nr:dephospho-CoA kinase [Alkaliphilus serpentinus]KAB3527260.1 dephospho-CoA kinase [Alkaliphilus serpentinus]
MGRIIGLTGGIASGKSTASKILMELGAFAIDADIISRRIVELGTPTLKEIKKTFGDEYFNSVGELNRRKLGNYVFQNKEALEKLNEITHPAILKEIEREIIKNKKTSPKGVIILDAALLIEMGLHSLVQEVWLVTTTREQQLSRLIDRDKLTFEAAEDRILSQMSQEEKRPYADRIIDNSGTYQELREQIFALWREITEI